MLYARLNASLTACLFIFGGMLVVESSAKETNDDVSATAPEANVVSPATGNPNIILIMADDMGAECVGAYGATDYKTPVLDQMASTGVKFDHCYSTPLCTPSRVQLMTGRYTHRNYIGFGKFPTGEVTFGNLLKKAGFSTCMVGKWQLGGDHATPNRLGFDEYCLQNSIGTRQPFDRSSRGRERHWGYPVVVANGDLYESKHRYGPDMLNEYACDFIHRKKGEPFFLYYPMILPHSPFTPSPLSNDGDKSGAKTSELKYFADMVEYIDVLVGRILATLEDEGIRENTVVIFTGDNGTTYPVKITSPAPQGYPKVTGIRGARHRSQLPDGKSPVPDAALEGPLTRTVDGEVPGGKDLMSSRGVHVPLIVDWPRYRKKYDEIGHRNGGLVDFTDFVPTLCELSGTQVPDDRTMDGRSLVTALKGESAETSRHTVFCHYWGFGRKQEQARTSIHDKRWKLYGNGDFFDLHGDIEEERPLPAGSLHPEAHAARETLKTRMDEILVSRPDSAKSTSNNDGGAKPPNVVLIYSDDQGWGDVGYHGYDDIMTPEIDELASRGTQFSQGYVCASVCGPSRAGLLTGVYQQRMGVYGNYDKGGVPTSQPMVFEMLEGQGYRTAAIGKWHVGMAREELKPNSRGVDFFYGFLSGSHDYDQSTTDPDYAKAHLRPIMRNRSVEPPIQDSNGYLTEMFTKEAVEFIGRTDDAPFFLYLSYNAVHHPWNVPESYLDRVQHLETHDERKLFAGMVLAMDDGVGAVMDALRTKGIEEETLVIFMSDNGSPRGQGLAQPRQKTRGKTTMSSPGPWNGFKGDTYEGGIRVPLVMHWPGKIPKGKVYSNPVMNLDLVPTIMSLCGVSNPGKGHTFDGVDLLPHVSGKKNGRPHEVLFWRRGEDYAIRAGDWKLAWNDESGPQTIQLFDLATDSGEWKDLSDRHPERAQALQDRFDAWDSQLPDNQTGRNPKNRNSGFATGTRVDVAKFNRSMRTIEAANDRISQPVSDRQAISLAEKLQQAKAVAASTGKGFDAERTTRWFHAKDLNHDGILDDRELRTKAPEGWNNR